MYTLLDFPLEGLREDEVWSEHIEPLLEGQIPENVFWMWNYCFTELLNNAIDHSEGTSVVIGVFKPSSDAVITLIRDNGVGIFRKIQEAFSLDDPREAILELAKGKLTTDPARHTGEGIFFSSRCCDDFQTHLSTLSPGIFRVNDLFQSK